MDPNQTGGPQGGLDFGAPGMSTNQPFAPPTQEDQNNALLHLLQRAHAPQQPAFEAPPPDEGLWGGNVPPQSQQQEQQQQLQRPPPPGFVALPPPSAIPPHLQRYNPLAALPAFAGGLPLPPPPLPGNYGYAQFAPPPPGVLPGQQRHMMPPPPYGPPGLQFHQQQPPMQQQFQQQQQQPPQQPQSLQQLLEQLSLGAQRQEVPGGSVGDDGSLPAAAAAAAAESPRDRDGGGPQTLRAPKFGSGGGNGPRPHRSTPAPGREGRWVDIMDRTHDGRSPRCNLSALDASLQQMAQSLMPTAEERSAWTSAFDSVRRVLQRRWPEAEVVLFGSAANGLSVRSSNDIDVSLQLKAVGSDADAKAEVVEEAAKLLEEAGIVDVLSLPKARVPVVKCTVPDTGTKVDVTVNNTLACINTKMLADYCQVDPRLAQLVALVKHWAKRRGVNDPYRGTLSSYCYALMCIFHLQTRSPPVLPVLQALPPTLCTTVGQWTAAFFDDVTALKGFGDENKQSLAELVWQFFEYWAWRHDYGKGVVSVRTGVVLSKDEKDWTRRVGNERHLLCVEDPFELSHDLGRTVDPGTRDVMRKEFLRAGTVLRDAENPLEQLFEQFKPRERHYGGNSSR